jgi:putative PIN family toxin of toxin-antitoxin system
MPNPRKIVLDTNCLIASLSRHSEYYSVWKGFQTGKYILCVSNDILEEYQEIIALKTSPEVARNVVNLLLKSKNVELVTPYFKFWLIEADHDDDKFVNCAFAANATYIVSNDKHFDILERIQFPRLLVLKLQQFLQLLENE